MKTCLQGLFVLLLVPFTAFAQETGGSPATAPRRAQIWLDPAQGAQPIRLQSVDIDIRLTGFVATTRMDLVFFNPNPRVLEGELVFPLAAGQSLSGYALEVDGKLRQGVVVEKQAARVAYESTVRQQIDPGLAELTQGNVFRTRLYPLPPDGSKRVQLSFDQPLLDNGKTWRYVLPLLFGQPVQQFKVRAEAVRAEHAPAAQLPGTTLRFDHWQDSYVAELQRRDFQPEGELAFDLPKPADAARLFSVEDREQPGWRHFAAQLQSAPPDTQAPPAAPRRISIWYDASGSAATRDRRRELDFLEHWLAQFGNADIALIPFRNEADAVQRLRLEDGKAAGLRQAIEALPLDGASDYGALRNNGDAAADLTIVIGDGLANFGDGEPQLDGTARVVFLHAAQRVDAQRLSAWARRAGGQVINLLELDTEAALRQAQSTGWALRASRVSKGQCADLVPGGPQPAGAVSMVYGRCSADTEIEYEFGDGSGTPLRRTLRPGAAPALDAERGRIIERLWAVARIAELDSAPQRDRKAIVELAKTWSVVSKETSLLVLDRIEDYVQHRVEPAEPELAAEYRRLLALQPADKDAEDRRREHRHWLIARWEEFRRWHNDTHDGLDRLLLPTAEQEAQDWEELSDELPRLGRHLAEARALHNQARKLRENLPTAADVAARQSWERRAGALMLRVDALRLRRLEALQAAGLEATARKVTTRHTVAEAAPAGAPVVATRHAPPPAQAPPAAQASPAPAADAAVAAPAPKPSVDARPVEFAEPPPTAGASSAGTDGEETLESIVVTGSRIRRVDLGEGEATAERSADTGIQLREWNPDAPYLARLRAARDPYAAYLQERAGQEATPAFFVDCADFFRNEAKEPRLALRVLSNLAEIDFDSAPLLRVLAYRLQQWQRHDLAVPVLEQVLELRGEEPQSRRDLALALARRPQPDTVRAATLLWEIADRAWDPRFPEVELTALQELNDIRARNRSDAALNEQVRKLDIPATLLQHQPLDLRVVLGWDSNDTDIDLWVVDPTGQEIYYSEPESRSGGLLSRDFTGGYGPEVFTLRHAIPGTYIVKTDYFADHQQRLAGPVTVQLEFQSGFDSGQGNRQTVMRRLGGPADKDSDEIEIGRFTVGLPKESGVR
jgi:Ca-activated chloride channel homolog